jgi:hypothetical protein
MFAHISHIDMIVNANYKSVYVVFNAKDQSTIVAKSFPPLNVGNNALKYVNYLKYLGHCGSDDDDIKREVCKMFIRTNILYRRCCNESSVI